LATIQDVAKLAGVSVSSVSNVLNEKRDRLRPQTFDKVRDAIQQLNYRPNRAARQLKTGRTPMIGLLVTSTANPFIGQIAAAIEAYAQQRYGYRVLLCNTRRDRRQEASIFQDLVDFGVGAVIVMSSLADERHVEDAVRRGLAVVSYDRGGDPDSSVPIDHVQPDNVEAGRLAASHLIAHGHRHMVFAMPAGMTVSRQAKIAGFRQAVEEAADVVRADVIEGRSLTLYGDSDLGQLGFELGLKLGKSRDAPTGIVAVNDMMAFGLMAGLRAAGKRIPDDVSVVGMDDFLISNYVWPALTSVVMPIDDMVNIMVDCAIARLSDPAAAAQEHVFLPTLAVRQSVASPPRGHGVASSQGAV